MRFFTILAFADRGALPTGISCPSPLAAGTLPRPPTQLMLSQVAGAMRPAPRQPIFMEHQLLGIKIPCNRSVPWTEGTSQEASEQAAASCSRASRGRCPPARSGQQSPHRSPLTAPLQAPPLCSCHTKEETRSDPEGPGHPTLALLKLHCAQRVPGDDLK